MNLITRIPEERITKLIGKNKILLIMGTRRVGKTILIKQIKSKYAGESLLLNAEDFDIQELLKKGR